MRMDVFMRKILHGQLKKVFFGERKLAWMSYENGKQPDSSLRQELLIPVLQRIGARL